MHFLQRSTRLMLCLIAIVLVCMTAIVPGRALAASQDGTQDPTNMTLGPVAPPTIPSQPLHLPINPPSSSNIVRQGNVRNHTVHASTSTCPAPTIDMKVLVISADGTEADLPAIQQALNDVGTPYTTYIASQTPNGLTPDKLSSGCHAYYQGVILTNGDLAYYNGSSWVSALSQQEWTNLWTFESTLGIRELSWYTYPTADFGYQAPTSGF